MRYAPDMNAIALCLLAGLAISTSVNVWLIIKINEPRVTCDSFSSYADVLSYIAMHPERKQDFDRDRDGIYCEKNFHPPSGPNIS